MSEEQQQAAHDSVELKRRKRDDELDARVRETDEAGRLFDTGTFFVRAPRKREES